MKLITKLNRAHRKLRELVVEKDHRWGDPSGYRKNMNTGTYAILYEDGHVFYQPDGECYANVGACEPYIEAHGKVEALLFHVYNEYDLKRSGRLDHRHGGWKRLRGGVHQRYYDWLFNRSPWAQCFVTKDADYALRRYVHVDPNNEVGLMQGGNIALRYPYEKSIWIKMWAELVDMGYDETMAFAMIHITFMYEDTINHNLVINTHTRTMHHVVLQPYTWEYLSNFVNGIVVNPSPIYAGFGSFQGTEDRWGSGRRNSSALKPNDDFEREVEKYNVEYIDRWSGRTSSYRRYKYEEIMKTIIDLAARHIQDNRQAPEVQSWVA